MENTRGPLNSADPTTGYLVSGVYNAVAPAPADQQVCALQLDSEGNLLVNVAVGGGGGSSTVKIQDSSGNVLNSNGSGALQVAVVSGGGSNPSVGLTGVAAPTSATEIGIIDGSGKLQGVSSSNPLRIDPTGSTTQPVSGTVAVTQATSPWTIQGPAASGAAAFGNPVMIGGVDTAGKVQELPVANNGDPAPNPVLIIGGSDFNNNTASIFVGTDGQILVGSFPAVASDGQSNILGFMKGTSNETTILSTGEFVFNGVTWDRERSVSIGNNVAAIGILAAGIYGQFNTVLPTIASGNYTSLQTDSSGRLIVSSTASALNATVVGTLTNNNAAPASTEIGVLPAVANAAGPIWTEGDQVLLSVDLSGNQRVTLKAETTKVIGTVNQGTSPWTVQGVAAAAAAASGNPVLIGGVDGSGNVQELPIANQGTTAPPQTLLVGGVDGGGLGLVWPLITGSGTHGMLALGQAFQNTDGQNNGALYLTTNGGGASPISVYGSVFNGITWDRQRSVSIGNNVAATGISASGVYGQYNVTPPVISDTNYTSLQTDSSGRLLVSSVGTTPPLPTNAAQETGGNLAAIATQTRNDAQVIDTLSEILTQMKLLNMNFASCAPGSYTDLDGSLMDIFPIN